MKHLLASCAAIAAIALGAPRPANAAALLINDAGPEGSIVFSMNDFEGGFTLDLEGVVQQGLNNPQSRTVFETFHGPLGHSFSADWITGGLVPSSGTIAFAEPGVNPTAGVSDILTFTYSAGPLGGHLVGTFFSDADDPRLPLELPAGATVVAEGTAFTFNNGNITASAISETDEVPVPEPATLTLLGAALLGFGALRRRQKA